MPTNTAPPATGARSARSVRSKSFRVGKVKAYLRGSVWYLCYHENGRRQRPRVGADRDEARKLAAQINAQLESGAASLLSFQPVAIPDLRKHWLDHHEHVLRSSLHTIRRYRAATDHLLNFLRDEHPVKLASVFTVRDAEALVRYLRHLDVAPNGHRNSSKRKLMDKGIKYILECCRALFAYAAQRRHLSPYATNPFSELRIDRIPVEDAKAIVLLTREQEKQFLEACDEWQFPVFATLMMTGLRPGELCHLLVEDLDLGPASPLMRVRNKRKLEWQVKTRSERDIPLVPELADLLREVVRGRNGGPVFVPPGRSDARQWSLAEMERHHAERVAREEVKRRSLSREDRSSLAESVWAEVGVLQETRLRLQFMKVTKEIGLPHLTMPKLLRHGFATMLQDANVDPLIRNQLMGHVPAEVRQAGGGLGMTALYTHTRPETVIRQLADALSQRPVTDVARRRLCAASFATEPPSSGPNDDSVVHLGEGAAPAQRLPTS